MSGAHERGQTPPSITPALLDRAPTAVALLDGPAFTFAYANQAFRALTPGRALLGRPLAEAWPELAGPLLPPLTLARERGLEHRVADQRLGVRRGGDGPPEERWWSLTVQPVPERPGAVALHVTDRSEAVRAARAAASQAEQVAEAIPQLVWRTTAAGLTEWLNRRFWEYTGLAPRDPASEPWREVIHEHDLPRVLHRWLTALRAGAEASVEASVEARLRAADGTYRWHLLHAQPLAGPDGRAGRRLVTATDVEELRRAHDAARVARRRAEEAGAADGHRAAQLDAVLEAIADGLVISTRENEFERANAAALRLLGLIRPGADWLQRFAVHDGEGREILPEAAPPARALLGEVVHGEELRLSRRGEPAPPRWLSVSAAPVRSPDGAIEGVVSTFSDITRLREHQERQADLLRAIGHDLRTPLTVILTQAQLLQRRPDDPDAVARRAAMLCTGAQRMAAMIDDLVDLVRLDAGLLRLERAPVELAPFVGELRDRLAGALPVERLRLELPEGLPALHADPARLERILVNLLSNALKYSAPGTEVTLSAAPAGEGLRLTVRDHGPGLTEDEAAHVFDRFYRTPSAAGKGGLGLGLYITRLLVAAHGGDIRVESRPGEGAAFHVRLPGPPAAT